MQDFISALIVNHHGNIKYHQKGKTTNSEQQKAMTGALDRTRE